MTDQDLLRDYAQSRDVDSLGAFLSRYQGPLLRFAARLLGDHDAAQDVVQETFLHVARDPRRLIGVESCHNWLLRVARNIGIDRLRREGRARRHAGAVAGQTAREASAREADRAGALEREETRARVRAEIDRLSPRYRELLLLKVEEEKSYREIASITGLSVTNVGYLLHLAMKDLSRRLHQAREDLIG